MNNSELTTIELMLQSSIWRPASITDEPMTELSNWQIYEVDGNFNGEPTTIHFVGNAGYAGRVCSPVVEFDKNAMKGRTRSGRIYELVGNAGYDSNADYVFHRWLNICENPTYRNITETFLNT